jgi:hypothetical protein
VAGVGGRVLDSHVHPNDAAGDATAPNLTVGDREVITTGSFNLTDTIDSLAEELSAKWRALDPFRVKPDEPSPLMLATMDWIELDPANPANFSAYGAAMADFLHPAIATISGLGAGGAAVVDGAGAVAAGGVRGLAAVGSGALDSLAAGADLLRRQAGVGGDAATALHGGATAIDAGARDVAGHVTTARSAGWSRSCRRRSKRSAPGSTTCATCTGGPTATARSICSRPPRATSRSSAPPRPPRSSPRSSTSTR